MAFVIWMTGLSCSGKTTISTELSKIFPDMEVLDGDKLYDWLAPLDMSKKARMAQTLRIAHITKNAHQTQHFCMCFCGKFF